MEVRGDTRHRACAGSRLHALTIAALAVLALLALTPNAGAAGRVGADFTGDGKDDVAWFENGVIHVLRGTYNTSTSTGNFTYTGQWSTGMGNPTWAGAGDFTGDGKDDLAWFENGIIHVLRATYNASTNTGNFTYAGQWSTGMGNPTWAGAGDYSGDGKDDLAWFQDGIIHVLRGTYNATTSAGSFTYGGQWSTGMGNPAWAGAGDFSGDGKDDLAWFQDGTTHVLRGTYNASTNAGSFTYGGQWSTGLSNPTWAGVGDFTGDGKDDLGWFRNGVIEVRRATYDPIANAGSFVNSGQWSTGMGIPTWASAGTQRGSVDGTGGDLNADGRDDLVFYHQSTGHANGMLSDGARFASFGTWRDGLTSSPDWAGLGDLNNDDRDDLVFYHQGSGHANAMLSDGARFASFGTWRDGLSSSPDWSGLGDVNGDGRDDLVFYHRSSGHANVMLSDGARFASFATWRTGLTDAPDWAGLGDVNGDGRDDLLFYHRSSGHINGMLSDGARFGNPSTWRDGLLDAPDWAGLGDVNGDSRDDLLFYHRTSGHANGMLSDGARFGSPTTWRDGLFDAPDWAGLGDFNSDGRDDLLFYHRTSGHANGMLSDGTRFASFSTWRDGLFDLPDWAGSGEFRRDMTAPMVTVTGGLYDARNQGSLTDGAITVVGDDALTGVTKIELFERLADGSRKSLGGTSRTCTLDRCSPTSLTWSGYSLNPAGWTTGTHTLQIEVTDLKRNVAHVNWSVQYYDTSWKHGGDNRTVDTAAEISAVRSALASAATDADWNAIWNGLRSDEQGRVAQGWPLVDDDLIKNMGTGETFYYAAGAVGLVTSSTVAYRLEYDLSTAIRVPAATVASFQRVGDITEAALDAPDEPAEPDETLRTAATAAGHPTPDKGYFWTLTKDLIVESYDSKAHFRGTLHWYRSNWNLWKRYVVFKDGARSEARQPGVCHTSTVGVKWSGWAITWGYPPSLQDAGVATAEGYTKCPSSAYTNAPNIDWSPNYRVIGPENKTKGNIRHVQVTSCYRKSANDPRLGCRSKKMDRHGTVESF